MTKIVQNQIQLTCYLPWGLTERHEFPPLTLLHSEQSNLYRVLAVLSAAGLSNIGKSLYNRGGSGMTRKSVHRTWMPPPNAIQKKGLYVTVTGILDTVNYMEPSQGEIIQKPKMQELSSLFMTHCLSVVHALVKFHKYIPYGLGVMAQTQFTIWN